MPELNTQFPTWMLQKTWHDKAAASKIGDQTLQAMQLGAQMAQQAHTRKLQNRAHELEQQSKTHYVNGMMEMGSVMEEGARNNTYADPVWEGKFWSTAQRYPQLMETSEFKGLTSIVENAKTAKARAEITSLTQQAITDRNDASIDSRFALFDQKLDGMAQVEGLKQENREALTTLRNDLNILRDSLKPTRTGQLVHDLTETDLASMRAELTTIDNLFKEGKITGTKKPGVFNPGYSETPASEYERRKREVMKSYDAKRIGTPRPAQPPSQTVAPDPAPPAAERVPGTIYQTPKGPYKWNGTGWEAP